MKTMFWTLNGDSMLSLGKWAAGSGGRNPGARRTGGSKLAGGWMAIK